MNLTIRRLTALASLALFGGASSAAVVHSLGAGSAVSVVQAMADFESVASLGVSYVESGMTFTRVGITTNNNGCGFAGCAGNFAAYGFVGNYFYGADDSNVFPESYIQIDAPAGQDFAAIEFLFGWGPNSHAFYWEAFDNGVLVGSGNGSTGPGSVLGLSGGTPFDRVRFTDSAFTGAIGSLAEGVSPAIDNVRVQFDNDVPEPGSLALIGLSLLAFGAARRRRG